MLAVARSREISPLPTPLPIGISRKVLLSFYLLVPGLFAVFLADKFLLEGRIKPYLEFSGLIRSVYLLVPFPHILASFFSFGDTDYLKFYRKKLALGIPLILGGSFFLLQFISIATFEPIFRSLTFFHVITQQVGITGLLLGNRSRYFTLWKWSIIAVGIIAGHCLFPSAIVTNLIPYPLLLSFVVAGNLVCLVLTFLVAREGSNSLGKMYTWANWAMLVAVGTCAWQNYFLIGYLIPRSIHDLTAFCFYVSHDQNRSFNEPRNYFYNLFSFLRLPVAILCPLISIGIVLALSTNFTIYAVVVAFSLCHYYIESFIWKPGTVHRSFIRMT